MTEDASSQQQDPGTDSGFSTQYHCSLCEYQTDMVEQMKVHNDTAHVLSATSFLCHLCQRSFKSLSSLERHLRSTSGCGGTALTAASTAPDVEPPLLTCAECGYMARSRRNMRRHERTEHEAPPSAQAQPGGGGFSCTFRGCARRLAARGASSGRSRHAVPPG